MISSAFISCGSLSYTMSYHLFDRYVICGMALSESVTYDR